MEKTLKIMNPITHMNNIQQNIIMSYFLFKKNKENGVYCCLTQENIIKNINITCAVLP